MAACYWTRAVSLQHRTLNSVISAKTTTSTDEEDGEEEDEGPDLFLREAARIVADLGGIGSGSGYADNNNSRYWTRKLTKPLKFTRAFTFGKLAIR